MKKINNNYGFMMAEVVVVSAIVLIVLGTLFISYNKLLTIYKTRVKYYDAVTLYRLGYYRDILIENEVLNELLNTAKDNNQISTHVYSSDSEDNSIINLPSEDERIGYEEDNVFLVYNSKQNISKSTLESEDIHETFKDYLDYLSTSTDFTDTNFLMIMERCNAKEEGVNINDCKYAYLKIYDGYEDNN